MTIFLFWIVFSILVGVYASKKGLSGGGYFFLSLLLSPLLGFLIAAVKNSDRQGAASRQGLKKCPFCAEYVQPEATVCRYCHSGLANVASPIRQQGDKTAPARKSRAEWALLAVGIVFVIIIFFALIAANRQAIEHALFGSSTPTGESSKPKTVESTSSTGNVAHDQLFARTKDDQTFFLGAVVQEGCVGNRAFYMGMDKELDAFWSVRCTNGQSYLVEIHPDATGSTQVLECSVLKAVAGVKCFARFEDE